MGKIIGNVNTLRIRHPTLTYSTDTLSNDTIDFWESAPGIEIITEWRRFYEQKKRHPKENDANPNLKLKLSEETEKYITSKPEIWSMAKKRMLAEYQQKRTEKRKEQPNTSDDQQVVKKK